MRTLVVNDAVIRDLIPPSFRRWPRLPAPIRVNSRSFALKAFLHFVYFEYFACRAEVLLTKEDG